MQASILVVDDDTLHCHVVARRLAREGYVVATAASGPEALTLMDRQKFDLVLLDLEMPGMDGLETMSRIHAEMHRADTPVIILSADTRNEARERCLAAGAADYLAKPLVVPMVRARIDHCLAVKAGSLESMEPHAPADQARILIVDDDDLSSRLLARQMEARGYIATCVNSGEAALAKLERERVDLVLLDIRMPTLSGTETLQRIRANDKTRRLPVVMVTASTDLADMLKCVDEGADGYVTKPVDIGWVSTCVHSAIETRRLGVAMPLG